MNEEKKSTSICRVCLNYEMANGLSKGLSLFDEHNNCLIAEKINALTNVDIKAGDGLPDRICPECLLQLESAFQFKQKCERTNEILLAAVNDVPTQNCDTTFPMKEEYLDDFIDDVTDYSELDDNITIDDLQASSTLETELYAALPKPSKAIDLRLECHDCGGFFKSKCKMRVHQKKVHMRENIKCEQCLIKFKSYAALNSHKKRNLKSCFVATLCRVEGEGKNRIFHCRDCDYHSIRPKDIASHIVTHTGEKPFQCDICPKRFTQLSALDGHKESAHKVYKVEGTCQHCGKHIKGRSNLYRHLQSHKPAKLACKICNVLLKNRNSLNNHMKRHTGIKESRCEMCPAAFYTAAELWCHKNKVHLRSKRYTCDICQYTTICNSSLKKHAKKHQESPYGCHECGRVYENENQLQLHRKRHTERNYKCPHCEKCYYLRKTLGEHVRKVHKLFRLNGTAENKSLKSDVSANKIV